MNWEYPSTLTEEERKHLLKTFDLCIPKNSSIRGMPLIVGTRGSHQEKMEELFYSPENYNLINEDTRDNTK